MHVTDFIGRLIEADNLPLEKCDAVCAFSGEPITEGVPLEIAIKKTFNDRSFLRYPSTHMSRNAYVCMATIDENNLDGWLREMVKTHRIEQANKNQNVTTKKKSKRREEFELRKYNFLATESGLRILMRERIEALLMDSPDPPFVFSITASNKKHRAFKSIIAFERDRYPVSLDSINIRFDREKSAQVLPIMQRWYTILPGKENTKQQPTWFWKEHIKFGCINQKMIAEYGVNRYFSENQILERFRGEPWFTLLLFTLNKGISE